MDDFLLLLQAGIDEATSKGKINDDIKNKLQGKVNELKLQASIDENSVRSIAEQLSKILNKPITLDNIQIGSGLKQGVSSAVKDIKKDINGALSDLNRLKANNIIQDLNLDRASIGDDIRTKIRSLVTDINSLGIEAAKTNSDPAWESLIGKVTELGELSKKYGKIRIDTEDVKRFAKYFEGKTISTGYKNSLLPTDSSVSQLKTDLSGMKVAFSSTKKEAIELDSIWEEMCQQTGRMDLLNITNAQDQIRVVIEELLRAKSLMHGEEGLIPHPDPNGYLNTFMNSVEKTRDVVVGLERETSNLVQQESQSSTASTNTIVQNEEKKQQAYRETVQAQKQISESDSLIKSGANVRTYEHTNNAAREALNDFRELLKEENAVISVSEKFGDLNGLTSFTVNVKRATGEVESLRYALKPILDNDGKDIGEFYFGNVGAEINNSGAIKQIQAIENAFADYTQKLAQFKSTNSEILSGLSAPISDFESKLSGLKNGTSTIDEVVNSYKSLNTEASKITENFSRQLSPIDSAIRKLASGEETIAGLRAEIKGLDNAPKELNSELNKCASLLENVKKIESEQGRSADWAKAYRQWSDSLDVIQSKLKTLKKEQSNVASTQIFNTADLKADNIAYITKVYNTIEKQMSSIQTMARNKGWEVVDVSGVEQADGKIKQLTLTVKDAEGAIKKLTMQREKLQGNGKAQYGLMQVGDVKVIETATQAQEKLAQSAEKANEKLAEQANKIQLSIETGGYESKVDALIAKTQQWTDAEHNARINTDALSVALKNLENASNTLAENNTVANQQAFISAEKELNTQIDIVTNSIRKMNAELAKDSAVASLHNKVADFMSKNGKAAKYYSDFKKIFNETAQGAKLTREEIIKLNQEFGNAVVIARNAGKLGKTFFQTLREGMSSFSYWTSSTFLVMKAIQSIKGGISSVKALDTALVDLKKTTTMTSRELEDFYYSSNKVAKQMGVTTEEIINQASAFSRLGYNSKEAATQMAKYSSWFKTISPGMDIEQAGDTLTSVMKAFKYDVQDVEKIMSMINTVGNNFAVSNLDISEILTRSSSAMMEANNSLADTIALGTAATEITRDAASVGMYLPTNTVMC